MISYFYILSDIILVLVRIGLAVYLVKYLWNHYLWRYFGLILGLSLVFGWLFHLIGIGGIIFFGFRVIREILNSNLLENDFLIFLLLLVLVFNGPGKWSIDFLFKILIF